MATIRVAKRGFEALYNDVMSKKESFEQEKELAIKKAIEEVNERFAQDEKTLEDCYLTVTEEQQVDDTSEEKTETAETSTENQEPNTLY